jgi:hypothetical protein
VLFGRSNWANGVETAGGDTQCSSRNGRRQRREATTAAARRENTLMMGYLQEKLIICAQVLGKQIMEQVS